VKRAFNKVQRAWAFYDWANSVYSLVIGTVLLPIYYEEITKSSGKEVLTVFGIEFINTALYSLVISISFFIIAVLSPYLASLADYSGKKKNFMKVFVWIGSMACLGLFFFNEGTIWIGLVGALFASLGFTGSLVFYNAFLPEIAEVEKQDRLSARGFALGYFGSSLLLIFNLVMVQKPELFGLEGAGIATRISFLMVGVWWLGFSQYTFKYLPNKERAKGDRPKSMVTEGYSKLANVWQEFMEIPRLKRFLFSFFWYSTGVQTIILLASIFGAKVLGLETSQLIISILTIQFVGIAGAILFSRISERIGNIKGIGIAVFAWVMVCLGAYFVETANEFYIVAGIVGLVMGGIQALSRSTYSKLLPQTQDHATYFSFYDVTEKVATMAGMFTMFVIEETTGDLRNAAIGLMAFFLLGFIQLLRIPKTKHVY
jgi:UMF1 family MFS transporter